MQKKLIVISFYLIMFFVQLAYGLEQPLWKQYKTHFITQDGRVIDYHQCQISHSEGQGYGMLLAVIYGDKNTFDRLWRWTKNNLQVRQDNLLAWCWGKRPNGEWEVIDYNNATDGDTLVAFALLKAAKKWHDNYYKTEGVKIVKDIREKLALNWQNRILLLPGYYGFVKNNTLVINPSYLILPAYRCFVEVDKKNFWKKIYKNTLFLLSQANFTSLRLPADWIILNKTGISIYTEKSRYFGYEAIRILLYLCWEKRPQFPPGVKEMLKFYKKLGYIPLWVDLINGSLSLRDAPAGFYAVYARVAQRMGEEALSKELFKKAREKLLTEKDDYYSFTLYLLAESKVGQ